MVSKKIVVNKDQGFDIETAEVIAAAAETYESRTEILYKYNIVNARSLLNIVSAAIVKGDQVEFRCEGPDEDQALAGILSALAKVK
ncbi:HPr family phosphocarrier protein [Parablautia sp. Marseille-Q6255]|uniref:HPr family phosphocarrier protein n=1 Tax=Parablautia sp. Marseille-Q6255 TaxID=3039593 RepID=UPI0024BD514A|nr:HPr family phosphocarrier protein [Parablautia sp. Marseille-Q6255]